MLTAAAVAVDGSGAASHDATVRLGHAWRDLRRGVTTGVLAEHVFGRPGEPGFVEPGHIDILELLVEQDGRRMSDLATALHVDPSTVTRTMHRMEAAGLARRAAAEQDGRVVTAHLTTEGRRLQRLVAARRMALIGTAFQALRPTEQQQLADLLERFLAALASTAGVATDPAG